MAATLEDKLVEEVIAANLLRGKKPPAPVSAPLTRFRAPQVAQEAAALRPPPEAVAPQALPLSSPRTTALEQSQAALQEKMNLADRAPLDYSGLEGVNKSRADRAGDDYKVGLLMSTLGGKHLAPAGGQIFQQALKDREPIRPNAADIGWTDPATGKVVQNPMMARNQEDKVLAGQMALLDKQMTHEIERLKAEGQLKEAERRTRELEEFRRQNLVSGGIKINIGPELAAARHSGSGDELTNQQRNLIAGHDAEITTIDSALKAAESAPNAFSFKRGVPGQIFGKLGESIVGRKDSPMEANARARVFNEVAALIKSRAGTAVSKAEETRVMGYMPTEYDDLKEVKRKLSAYQDFVKEKRDALNVVVPKRPGTDRRQSPTRESDQDLINKY